MSVQETSALHKRMNRLSALLGTLLVDGFHYVALFAIGSTTGGLWISEDQGESWRNLSSHLPPIYCVRFA